MINEIARDAGEKMCLKISIIFMINYADKHVLMLFEDSF